MSSFVLHIIANKADICFPQMPFCKIIPISIINFQTAMFLFLRELCALFRPLPRSEFFSQRKQETRTFSLSLPPLFLSLFFIYYLSLLYLFFLSLDTPPLSLFITAYPFPCFPLSLHRILFTHTSLCRHINRPIFSKIATFRQTCDLMSKKVKGIGLDSMTPFGIGVYDDARARLKYQTLMQDYDDLQKDADAMRSKLEASKQRKLMLATEVRFLRKRYAYLVKTKNANSSQEQNLVPASNLLKRAKIMKEQCLIGNEASQHRLPIVPDKNSKKKQVALREAFPVSDQPRKKKSYSKKEAKGNSSSLISPHISAASHKGVMHIRKELIAPNLAPILDRTLKGGMFGANEVSSRNLAAAFDLNQDSPPGEKEASMPTRAPIFDLNEISTGDEDFQGDVEPNQLEEARKSLIRGLNEVQQNDLKLSICRNAGESSSRAGKRKISWQDPVALRV